SDLLAAKKLIGVVSHASKMHPCHQCSTTLAEINKPAGYDWRNFRYRSPDVLLKAAFEYERAGRERRQELEDRYGVRFSPLLRLLGVDHGHSSPVDGLHNSFLGIAKSLVNMLLQRRLFSPSSLEDYIEDEVDEDDRIAAFVAVFEEAVYPGHLGRLPARVTKQFATDREKAGSGLKADQWKRIMQLLPIALFMALKGETDQIPDRDLDNPSEIDAEGEVDVLANLPTLHGGIAPSQRPQPDRPKKKKAKRGKRLVAVDDLSQAAQDIMASGGRLTINWHIAMHHVETVKRYGPLSGYSTYAFERNNGKLARVKNNGQEKDLPITLMRSW
ncbi:hypothetical protein HD553DRAFT_254952, partial [Filobasidium floriforme]|uniref:uncharacterized protein n=1 Tax=Filobasidium floriforme TaxID=5210 RepID=UPI001E8D5BF6